MLRLKACVTVLAAGFAVSFAGAQALAQGIRYVDASAPAGGDGASWATAYRSLHDGLAGAAPGTEVRVAQGRYVPAGPGGDRSISFTVRNGVRLMGGYAGLAGADPDERDPATYITTLSGDLNGNDAPGFLNRSDNTLHVLVTFGNVNSTTLIDGLLVSGGNADINSLNRAGAGLFIAAGSPTIVGCTFTDNMADETFSGGGGVASFSSGTPTFIDCSFVNNSSRWPFNTAHGFGGGLYALHANLSRCTFEGNRARQGGALYVGSSVVMQECRFIGNTANLGGAVYRGGSDPVPFVAVGCEFRQNTAATGGGIYFFNINLSPIVLLDRCTFIGNAATSFAAGFGGAIVNLAQGMTAHRCLFIGNSAATAGGAITTSSGTATILNCTIANNTAPIAGGIMLDASDSSPSIRNSILWANAAEESALAQAAQIARYAGAGPSPAVNYSCVQGLDGALGGVGNIGDDPLFNDPVGGDYTLAVGSPCINAGDPDPMYNDPDGSRNDMGAFVGVANVKPDAVAVCQQLTSVGATAIVRLDGTGSADPNDDTDTLTFEWFVDGQLVCSGNVFTCGLIEVPMSFGSHEVLLRVTDPAGEFDEDLKFLTLDPASLALLNATSVTVNFANGRASIEGEISLPSTVHQSELQPVIAASLSLGGLQIAAPVPMSFTVGGSLGDKWSLASGGGGAINSFVVDWGGARVLYREPRFPVQLQADLITNTQSVLTISCKPNQTGPFTVVIGGYGSVHIAGNGTATGDFPVSVSNNKKEFTVTLPGPIAHSTTFQFTGGVNGSVVAGDYLSYSVGRFRMEANFDTTAFPAAAATSPRSVDLSLWVGAQGYPGATSVGAARLTVQGKHWRAK